MYSGVCVSGLRVSSSKHGELLTVDGSCCALLAAHTRFDAWLHGLCVAVEVLLGKRAESCQVAGCGTVGCAGGYEGAVR